MIRKATRYDAEAIAELARSRSLTQTPRGKTRNGFLVSDYNASDYQQFLDRFEHVYVLEMQNQVEAFLMAYTGEEMDL